MTVAKYLRISNEDADLRPAGKAESDSIANQRNLLDSFIARHNELSKANIVEFCDDGWSGKNFERPGVQAMLDEVKRGKIQCIVVKDLSRFGRDYLTVGNYISRIFPFMGVRFIAVNDGLDSVRPGEADSLDTSFKALLYDLYSRDISRKVKNAKRFRAQRGDFVAPFAPYGYMKSPENHNQLVIDPPAAAVVRRIFKLVAQGHSAVKVARTLNGEAVPTPMLYKRAAGCSRTHWSSVQKDNFWTDTIVIRIIRDEQYLGTTTYGKRVRDTVGSAHTVKVSREDWVAVANTHEAIVTREEFDRAQAALREFKEHKLPSSPYPLAGKVLCAECGHVLLRSHGKEAFFYCQTRNLVDDSGCKDIHIPEKDLLDVLVKSLRVQAAVAVEREKVLAREREAARQRAKDILKEIAVLETVQSKCSWESRELYEAFALENMSKEDYLAQKGALAGRAERAEVRAAELQNELDGLNEGPEDRLVQFYDQFVEIKTISDETIKELLKGVRVYPNGQLEIEWNFSISDQ